MIEIRAEVLGRGRGEKVFMQIGEAVGCRFGSLRLGCGLRSNRQFFCWQRRFQSALPVAGHAIGVDLIDDRLIQPQGLQIGLVQIVIQQCRLPLRSCWLWCWSRR